jgi:hypothetical protein
MKDRRTDPGTIAETQRQAFESDWLAGRSRPIEEQGQRALWVVWASAARENA